MVMVVAQLIVKQGGSGDDGVTAVSLTGRWW